MALSGLPETVPSAEEAGAGVPLPGAGQVEEGDGTAWGSAASPAEVDLPKEGGGEGNGEKPRASGGTAHNVPPGGTGVGMGAGGVTGTWKRGVRFSARKRSRRLPMTR